MSTLFVCISKVLCTMMRTRQCANGDMFAQACSCSSSWPSWRLKTWRSGVVCTSSSSNPSSSPSAGSRCSSRRSSTFPVILAAWRHYFPVWSSSLSFIYFCLEVDILYNSVLYCNFYHDFKYIFTRATHHKDMQLMTEFLFQICSDSGTVCSQILIDSSS